MSESPVTTSGPCQPPFWSLAFHLHFFPNLLRHRYRAYRGRGERREHVFFEIPLMIAACAVVGAIGLPSALKGSITGVVMVTVGSLGLIAMVTGAVISEYRSRLETGFKYTYDHFIPSAFIFFVTLGLTAGIVLGGLVYESKTLTVCGGLAGLCIGYVVGIPAGIWVHALGFMAIWFIYAANVLSAFMLLVDCITLLLVFK